MGYMTVGNTRAEWDDTAPLVFTLSEEVGQGDERREVNIKIDLSDLRHGFSNDFILILKEALIQRRNKVSLKTVAINARNLLHLFSRVINLCLFEAKIDIIDEGFLLVLDTVTEKMTNIQLKTLKAMFLAAPHSPLWAQGLHASSFPKWEDKKGRHGRLVSRILAKALTRAACVHILSTCEQAYDLGKMDLGLFSFANLAFAVFCRPESYRQIQLSDLTFDEKSNAYFLNIFPVKSRVKNPAKIRYRINEPLGILLQKQRQSVVDQYSHLVAPQDVSKLALFPARKLNPHKSAWLHEHANKYFGMYGTAEAFALGYPRQISRLFRLDGLTIGANVLRHTVGTQLAQTGASSQTIQAVLKHASDYVCQTYVDIAFHGLIDALSDAMQPAFEKHLPVFTRFRSKNDPVNADRAVRSDDPETGKIELTGECGKLVKCEYAPITCYGCMRFIPCWDADHGVNLAVVQEEIEDYKKRGTPFQQLIEKAQVAKYQIVLVMNAAALYSQACTPEAHHE